jgi:type II secretory pathway pseudopilin PulG
MHSQKGFTYVIAMFLVAALSVMALSRVRITVTKERRDQEARLIEVGMTYRQAIRSYFENSPGTERTYPPTLEALLSDDRTTTMRRHLRKLYRDPITGDAFALLRTEGGGIKGVFSTSPSLPIKQAGFPEEVAASKNAAKYSDWQFLYVPNEGTGPGEEK